MRRRREPPPPKIAALQSGVGEGVSLDIRDRTSRLSDAELRMEDVVATAKAVTLADDAGDSAPVVGLLRSRIELTRRSREIIADWLERWRLKRPRGRQRTPSHEYSESEFDLTLADERVTELVRHGGIPEGEAIAEVAASYNIPEKTLQNFRSGKRGSTRRMMRRP